MRYPLAPEFAKLAILASLPLTRPALKIAQAMPTPRCRPLPGQRVTRHDLTGHEGGSFRTWLTVLARNSALNRLRAQHPEDVTLHEGLPHGDGSAEDALLRRERQQQLTAALSRLPSDERALFYRKYWYRQPTAQIAAELGLSPLAVEGRLYRIRQKLRQELGGDFCGE